MEDDPIYFYDLDAPYGQFGNFYPAPIELDGETWPTTEHYFHAQKFTDNEEHYYNILHAPTPRKAFEYAHDHNDEVRSDWADVKDDVMLTACTAKFNQHDELRHLLLSTGDRTLVEHTTNDTYWADGGDGSGRNQLGITLMEVRDEL